MLKETLRLYPTAPGTARDIQEDMVIDGVHIPGGVSCVVSNLVFGLFGSSEQQVCVSNKKCFIPCFCCMYINDPKTHTPKQYIFQNTHLDKALLFTCSKMFNKLF